VVLKNAGFGDVANLAGGMLRWQAESLPVDGGGRAEPASGAPT